MTAKTKLNKSSREAVLAWMQSKLKDSDKRNEVVQLMCDAIKVINPIIRAKYPEKDMIVLRKYDVARYDHCLRFSISGGDVFAFNLPYALQLREESKSLLADMPSTGGCHSNVIFEATIEVRKAVEAFMDKVKELDEYERNKKYEYYSFVESCRYVEDIETVVPLPEDLRTRITGNRTAMAHINPEIIQTIADDFAA